MEEEPNITDNENIATLDEALGVAEQQKAQDDEACDSCAI